jgi:hypothetical protein
VSVTGRCRIGEEELAIDAVDIQDRTWGRDESVGIVEYAFFFLTFATFSITAMRFIGSEGFNRTDGFLLTESAAEPIEALSITRDPAGLCAAVEFQPHTGEALQARSLGRRGGFWVPMGPERRDPAMSAYDEFAPFRTAGGETGFGIAEHGTVRQLF